MYPDLTPFLVGLGGAGLLLTVVLAVRGPLTRRLALRQVSRRRAEAALVVAGSVLGTAIIVGSLVVGDTLDQSFKQTAYRELGVVDEVRLLARPGQGAGGGPPAGAPARRPGGRRPAHRPPPRPPPWSRAARPSPRRPCCELDFAAAAGFEGPGSSLAGPAPGRGRVVLSDTWPAPWTPGPATGSPSTCTAARCAWRWPGSCRPGGWPGSASTAPSSSRAPLAGWPAAVGGRGRARDPHPGLQRRRRRGRGRRHRPGQRQAPGRPRAPGRPGTAVATPKREVLDEAEAIGGEFGVAVPVHRQLHHHRRGHAAGEHVRDAGRGAQGRARHAAGGRHAPGPADPRVRARGDRVRAGRRGPRRGRRAGRRPGRHRGHRPHLRQLRHRGRAPAGLHRHPDQPGQRVRGRLPDRLADRRPDQRPDQPGQHHRRHPRPAVGDRPPPQAPLGAGIDPGRGRVRGGRGGRRRRQPGRRHLPVPGPGRRRPVPAAGPGPAPAGRLHRRVAGRARLGAGRQHRPARAVRRRLHRHLRRPRGGPDLLGRAAGQPEPGAAAAAAATGPGPPVGGRALGPAGRRLPGGPALSDRGHAQHVRPGGVHPGADLGAGLGDRLGGGPGRGPGVRRLRAAGRLQPVGPDPAPGPAADRSAASPAGWPGSRRWSPPTPRSLACPARPRRSRRRSSGPPRRWPPGACSRWTPGWTASAATTGPSGGPCSPTRGTWSSTSTWATTRAGRAGPSGGRATP